MSALAKVFVVFVFILSIAFFGTSATLFKVRHDWKTGLVKLRDASEKQLGLLEERISALSRELDNKAKELDTSRFRQDQLAAEKQKLSDELTQEKSNVEAARSEVARLATLAEQHAKTLETFENDNQKLRTQIEEKDLQRTTAIENARVAREERDRMRLDLQKSQQDLHIARTEYTSLSSEFDTLQLLVERYQTVMPDLPGPTLPPIDALVNAVDNEEKLVVLSKGKDDDVETGFEFTVYRGEKFIGKVQVIKVYPNLSGAKILFTKDGAEIQRGDEASTRVGVN